MPDCKFVYLINNSVNKYYKQYFLYIYNTVCNVVLKE